MQVPCGYCIECRADYARQTAIRITHEASMHTENSFVTLTYDDTHMPEHGSLRYADLIRFWKRLRKHLNSRALPPMRYYAVGEYGDKSMRPHYHACIFGHAFAQDRIIIRESPTLLWTSPMLSRAWGLGNVAVGALTFETARYTASYVVKKLKAKQRHVRVDEDSGELIAVEQPRAFMSRNIAKTWWQLYGHQARDHDFVVINGKRQKPPRAYDKWSKEVEEQRMEEIKKQRKEKAKKLQPEQRRARAKITRARIAQKTATI